MISKEQFIDICTHYFEYEKQKKLFDETIENIGFQRTDDEADVYYHADIIIGYMLDILFEDEELTDCIFRLCFNKELSDDEILDRLSELYDEYCDLEQYEEQ